MDIGKEMFDKAVKFLNYRYGKKTGGVAVLRLETGAICEAHKLNKKVTHSLCICRQNDNADYEVLSPCGTCQERLFYWGSNVKCAISTKDNSVVFKTLEELQPYYWLNKK